MAHAPAQLVYLSLAEVSTLIAKRELSPVELTQAMLDRITAVDPRLHSYYTVFTADALSAAREAEAQIRAGNYHVATAWGSRSQSKIFTNPAQPPVDQNCGKIMLPRMTARQSKNSNKQVAYCWAN